MDPSPSEEGLSVLAQLENACFDEEFWPKAWHEKIFQIAHPL